MTHTIQPEVIAQICAAVAVQVKATMDEHYQTSPENNDPWLDTHQAAAYLNIATGTLANSRSTGTLLGIKSPKVTHLGRKACYRRSVLDQFRSELEAAK